MEARFQILFWTYLIPVTMGCLMFGISAVALFGFAVFLGLSGVPGFICIQIPEYPNRRVTKCFLYLQPGKWGFLHFHLRVLSDSVFFYTLAEASQSS